MFKSSVEVINDTQKVILTDYALSEMYKANKAMMFNIFKKDSVILPDEILKYLKKKKITNLPKLTPLDDSGFFYNPEELNSSLKFFSQLLMSGVDLDEKYIDSMDSLSRYPDDYFMGCGKEPEDTEISSIYGIAHKKVASFTIKYIGNETAQFFAFLKRIEEEMGSKKANSKERF